LPRSASPPARRSRWSPACVSTAAGDSDVTPRLNAAWELADRTTLRAAWGRYAQAQGWHELAVQFGDTTFYPSEKAEHRVLSLEHRLKSGLSLRAEAYERVTTDPRPHWFSRFDAYNLFPEAQGDRILLQPSDATARGLEFIVQRRGRGAFDWSASYALARATEQVGAATIPVARDQRHTFSLDTTYRVGPWSFGAAWQYHTGWPTTDVFHTLLPLNNGGRVIVRSYGPTLGARLPAYHRLDLRASRTFKVRAGEITVFLDIFNAYDHANPIAYDYDTSVAAGVLKVVKRPRNMLPILPTAGITWER
jgi:outer membrane receptor protein involved in Fe transport